MVITYFGKQFFKLQFGDTVIAVNPVSKDSKLASSRFGADVGLISVNHPDYNGAEALSFGDREALIINGPGEYEAKGIFIRGFLSEANIGNKKYINTIYTLALDGINLCFLGALTEKNLSSEIKEAIEGADIIFVPAGLVIPPRDAYNLASSLDPKIIIPVDYDVASLKMFLKEGGSEDTEVLDKYTVKRKDVEGKEGEIVVLESQK